MNTCVIVSEQLKWTNKDHFSCLHKYIHNILFKNARVTISKTRQNHWWKYAKQVKWNQWWRETSQATSLKNSEQNLFFTGMEHHHSSCDALRGGRSQELWSTSVALPTFLHIGTFTFWGPGLHSWHPNHIRSLYSWRKTCLVGIRLVTVHIREMICS